VTGRADFSEEEWKQVLEGPPAAGLMVVAADRGGMFRETLSMGKAYAAARQQHGQSALLDEIVTAKPQVDHSHVHSPEELRERCLGHVRDGVALVAAKADPEELAEYKKFVVGLAEAVARAHKEGGDDGDAISEREREAIAAVTEALS
jgi:hypothetical protein